MWLALKRTVCFLRRVGNHSRRAAKDAASRNEFAYRLAPFTLRWMRSLLSRVEQSQVGWGAPTANHTSDDRHDHHHSHVRQSTDCPGDFDDVTGETLQTCRHSYIIGSYIQDNCCGSIAGDCVDLPPQP